MTCLRGIVVRPGVMVLVMVVLAAGCGGPASYPVTGRVQFRDGSPLSGCRIEFTSQSDGEGLANASGDVQADGTFRLNQGLVEGVYLVSVTERMVMEDRSNERKPPKLLVDRRYQNPKESKLTAAVTKDTHDFTFTVEKPSR